MRNTYTRGGRRPKMTPAQEAARLRVSAKVIARANRKRLRPYVERGVRAVPAHGSGP